MVANRVFRLGILVVFVFILLTGLTASTEYQEGTTRTSEMDQNSTSNENGYASETHIIVLTNNALNPETTEINQYDKVIWRNLNKPKRSFVLVSEDNLWKDFSLGYGKSFEYTFNKTGTFGFIIKDEKDFKGTVVVNKARETAGTPLPEKETPKPEKVTPKPTEKVTPKPTEKVITKTETVQGPENSVVIRGSVFYPETLELNKGDTLVWKNLNKPKRSFTLVSEEGLFKNQIIGYGKSFSYTFDEAGDYAFKLKEIPDTKLIIKVG